MKKWILFASFGLLMLSFGAGCTQKEEPLPSGTSYNNSNTPMGAHAKGAAAPKMN